MEKTKNKEKKYVGLIVNNYQTLAINKKAGTHTIKTLHNDSESILFDCTKAEQSRLFKQVNNGYKVDFTLVCGKISFYVEKEAAIEILKFQEDCLTRVQEAKNAYDAAIISHKPMDDIFKAEKRYERINDNVTKRVLYFIKKNYLDSISPYAYVSFYDLGDYSGSYYNECNSNYSSAPDCSFDKPFASGIIDINDFVSKLNSLGYIEGINPGDASISKPLDYMEQSFKEGSSSYFGYAITHSPKALRGRSKTSK